MLFLYTAWSKARELHPAIRGSEPRLPLRDLPSLSSRRRESNPRGQPYESRLCPALTAMAGRQGIEPRSHRLWRPGGSQIATRGGNKRTRTPVVSVRSAAPTSCGCSRVVADEGIEPSFPDRESDVLAIGRIGHVVRAVGIEPTSTSVSSSRPPSEHHAHVAHSPRIELGFLGLTNRRNHQTCQECMKRSSPTPVSGRI